MNQNIGGVRGRRRSALDRLENQLKTKVKTKKIGQAPEPLTDADVKRISQEIEKLRSKIS
jgi:hypothetical protein